MNTPYIKQYDKNGILTNPIKGKYVSEFPNRSARRKEVGISKRGEHKPANRPLLLVSKRGKGRLWVQRIKCKTTGELRKITHYTEVK